MFTLLLPTLNDSSVRKVQRNPQGRGSASPRGFSRDEISIGGLEEGLVLARRRRDKEAASQGAMQGKSIKYVSAESHREKQQSVGKAGRQRSMGKAPGRL